MFGTLRCIGCVTLLTLCAYANGIVAENGRATPLPPIRLTSHRVAATVRDRVASVTVEQVFLNRGSQALEGTYLFPLPRDAAVTGFSMTMGDQVVEGEVLAAPEARRIYESIVRRRRDPGLLEFVGQGLYRARVFPIEPGGRIRVAFTYQQVLPEEQGTIELRYPLATEVLNQVPVESVFVDVCFESTVDLKSVYSPSHAVAIHRDGTRKARATLEASRLRAVRDLLVYFGRDADEVGFTLLSSKPAARDGTFLAVLAPRPEVRESELAPKDVLYVVDVSGSMNGRKLEQAKQALDRTVSMLRARDRFNIVAFASDWTLFRPEFAPASTEAKQAAARWIGELRAAGGTALEGALAEALRMAAPDRLGMVVLLTDGLPTVGLKNADEIVARVKTNNKGGARVFTFGVGTDLDVKLLDRIAEATGGAREYVAPHERIDAVIGRFFRSVDQPVLTDLALDLGPGVVQVYPRELPDLFVGSQIVVMGRYARPGPRTIRLRGRSGGREVVHEHEATFANHDRAPYLERLWAQRKVAFLLDEIRLHGENGELVAEITGIATRHAIVTPYTAGLVVEPRGGSFRGPSGGAPPGMREPSDPAPPPSDPAGPSASSPIFASPPARSKRLRRRKERALVVDAFHVTTAADKTFRRDAKGRWIDTSWDGKGEPVRIEAYTDAYFELIARGDRIARYLAVGERVVLQLGKEVYEIVPPK